MSLDRAVQTTVLWLNDIQEQLGWDNKDNVYKATKAVLQTIRDRISFEEVVHLSANLPMIMKGMMMDGYDMANKPLKIRMLEEFYEQIQQNYDGQRRDIVNASQAAKVVIRVLRDRMGGGEMAKICSAMPKEIRQLFLAPQEASQETPAEMEIPQHQ